MAEGGSFAGVFISYVEEDSAVALEIAEGLQGAGYTTWCYEVDSVPGVSYLVQTSRAIEQSRAVIVLISPHSLGSHQVTKEVVRAHETEKPFLPVLISISHVEYANRQPEWREAIGSATSISVPKGGVGVILPRILGGLEALGIEADAAATASKTPSGAGPRPPAEVVGGGPHKKKLVVAAVAAGLVGIAATAALALGGGDKSKPVARANTVEPAGDTRTDKTTATTDFNSNPEPEEEILDSATAAVETSAGPARVLAARLSSQVCPTGGVPEPCRTASGGTLFLIVELVAFNQGEVLPNDAIFQEAFSSYVIHAGQKVTTTENWLLEDSTGRQTPSGIRVIYAVLPASAVGQDMVLYWPQSLPVRLHPTT